MRFTVCIAAAAISVLGLGSGPTAAQTKLVDIYRDWATYSHDGAPAKVCFALAEPKATLPKSLKRSPVFFYVSVWPQDGIRAEISIKMGYAPKKGGPATVKVGPAKFKLYIKDDKAFVEGLNAEQKLIDAMKRGATMIVEGRSPAGKVTKDTYSLRGVTKAIESLTRSCP